MAAGRDDRVIVEVLADLAAEGGFDARQAMERRGQPVCGVRDVEVTVHRDSLHLRALVSAGKSFSVNEKETCSETFDERDSLILFGVRRFGGWLVGAELAD